MTLMRTSGRVVHIRPLPSDSTTDTVPVSATAKLTPLIPTRAPRNSLRRCRRAVSASSLGSSERSAGASSSVRTNSARICSRFLWIAGTRMWDGVSSESWMMSWARSVSQARMPRCASASLRWVSSVVSDLALTTSSAPWAAMTSPTMRLHSSASRAQCTTPPARVTDSSSWVRCASRWRRTRSLSARPASRSSSQSGISATTPARLARIVWVA